VKNILLLFGKPAIKDKKQFLLAVKNLEAKTGCLALVIDADIVVSEKHIYFAVEKAMQAFSEGKNIAKDVGMEILRYACGERQIERALSKGFTDSTERIALILMANQSADWHWPEPSELSEVIITDGNGCKFKPEGVRVVFNITPEELEAVTEAKLPDLVLERVALTETFR
jgi:KEOPS complex subunit Cgi121